MVKDLYQYFTQGIKYQIAFNSSFLSGKLVQCANLNMTVSRKVDETGKYHVKKNKSINLTHGRFLKLDKESCNVQ